MECPPRPRCVDISIFPSSHWHVTCLRLTVRQLPKMLKSLYSLLVTGVHYRLCSAAVRPEWLTAPDSRPLDFERCHFPSRWLLVLSRGHFSWKLQGSCNRHVGVCRPDTAERRRSTGPSALGIRRTPCWLCASRALPVNLTESWHHPNPAPASRLARMSTRTTGARSCHRHLLGHRSEPVMSPVSVNRIE